MKKILFGLLLLPSVALAQSGPVASDLMGLGMPGPLAAYFQTNGISVATLNNNSALKSANATPAGAALNLLYGDTANNTVLNALTAKKNYASVATTPQVSLGTAGVQFEQSTAGLVWAPYVATPATNLTPVAGTNDIRPYTVIATAAPTSAALALPASPTDGERRELINQGANPVVIAALGTPGMNFPVTPGPRRLIAAAKTKTVCEYSANAVSWVCSSSAAVPTPAS